VSGRKATWRFAKWLFAVIVIATGCFSAWLWYSSRKSQPLVVRSHVSVPLIEEHVDDITTCVLLFESQTPVLVSSDSHVRLYSPDDDEKLAELPQLVNVGVAPIPNGIMIGENTFASDTVRISPKSGTFLSVAGRRYRGTLLLVRSSEEKLIGINEVYIGDYVQSVVTAEMPWRWPMEALKAQAIAARTYALWRSQQRRGRLFYLFADSRDQVYRGVGSESRRSRKATSLTRGVVLVENKRLLPAFFHSTCGGETESAELIFNIAGFASLKGVTCDYCSGSKFYRWHRRLAVKDVSDALAKLGYDFENVDSIKIERDVEFREILVKGTRQDGSVAVCPVGAFRSTLGTLVIRTTFFEARREGDDLIFEGRGWGHFVGMCQWGARKMAKEGHGAGEILEYYYPGSELAAAY